VIISPNEVFADSVRRQAAALGHSLSFWENSSVPLHLSVALIAPRLLGNQKKVAKTMPTGQGKISDVIHAN
jgi:hypothetical protein